MIESPDGAPAIPLWINGHAFLTVTEHFYDVADAVSGKVIRRVPLCGADEANEAARAARAVVADWATLPAAERRSHLVALSGALAGYGGHFAKLVGQEAGLDLAAAQAEVAAAVTAFSAAGVPGSAEVVAVIVDAGRPLAALVEQVVPILAAGGAVVVKPSPKAPSAAFALCELSARAGWPAGVLNLLQGDEAAVVGLCAADAIDRVVFVGGAVLGERIAAIAAAAGKPFTVA